MIPFSKHEGGQADALDNERSTNKEAVKAIIKRESIQKDLKSSETNRHKSESNIVEVARLRAWRGAQ